MNIKKLASISLVCSATALAAAPAQAGVMLSLYDGTNPAVVIADGGVGDFNSASNAVTWIGSLGVWTLNVSTALSFAPDGNAGIDLNSIDNSSGAGTLQISMWTTGNDFTSPIGNYSLMTSIGGGTAGNVGVDAYLSGAWVNSVGPLGPTFGPAFGGSESTGVTTTIDGFDLKQVVTITHEGAGASSFNSTVTVPEPGILSLLGLGLLGLGFLRRRFAA